MLFELIFLGETTGMGFSLVVGWFDCQETKPGAVVIVVP